MFKNIVAFAAPAQLKRKCQRTLKKEIYGINIEILDIDSVDGADKAKIYGVISYPAFVVTRDDGQVQNIWEGESYPTKDELESYLVV